MEAGELAPDLGPPRPHPTAGATLVTARPPLAAFNLELEGASLAAAREIAADLRESGGGLPGVRAIGLEFGESTQISTNVHDPLSVPLAAVVARVAELARGHRARVVRGRDRRPGSPCRARRLSRGCPAARASIAARA